MYLSSTSAGDLWPYTPLGALRAVAAAAVFWALAATLLYVISPGLDTWPRLLVFSSVAQASHQSQPNSRRSSSVVAPLMNAHSSPIGLRQKLSMLRSTIIGKAAGGVAV